MINLTYFDRSRINSVMSLKFQRGTTLKDDSGNEKLAPAAWGRAANDGHWYDFSPSPEFFFYVYTAFLVDHKPQDEIRLISITRKIKVFILHQLDFFCVVRFSDGRNPHVAFILLQPRLRISSTGSYYQYVYRCSLPACRPKCVPASIR